MEYTTIVFGNSDAEAWELQLVAKDKETLDNAKKCFDNIMKFEGAIVIDPTDVRTLFYEKETVFAGYTAVSEGTQLNGVVVELATQFKKDATKELLSALIFIEGDVAFLEAVETSEKVHEVLGEDANIVFGISESSGQEGVTVLLALA